ncbi:SIR2 family protein [bacterium]|nr:SIR2 family protein [bacterium]
MTSYEQYLSENLNRLEQLLHDAGCRPMLFVGSGLSRRYIESPSWSDLMKWLIRNNPSIDRPYGYFYQRANQELSAVGSLIVKPYQEFAWQVQDTKRFPDEIYHEEHDPSIFLKVETASLLSSLLKKNLTDRTSAHPLVEEIDCFRCIQPHAIITTNYDKVLEVLFPDHKVIVGQEVIRKHDYTCIGEILKIHGCVSDPSTMVLTHEDYDEFMQRKKYLSAKLLTYFAEFPMVLIGYSAADTNIKAILTDIAKMVVTGEDELVPNIWLIGWNRSPLPTSNPPSEKVLNLGNGSTLRVNYVEVPDFKAVAQTLSKPIPLSAVNVRLLRALSANVYQIITSRSAKTDITVNLELLKQHGDEEQLSKVLGFSDAEPADALGSGYPYILKKVAEKLGYDYWHWANELIKKVALATGFNLKENNNKYHQETQYGKVPIHRYSYLAIDLLEKVRDSQPYSVELPDGAIIKVE